jgi:hypothetical protein
LIMNGTIPRLRQQAIEASGEHGESQLGGPAATRST